MVLKTKRAFFPSAFIIVLLSALIFPGGEYDAQADNTSTSVSIGNSTPAVSAVTVNGNAAITLTENTTQSVIITATVTDNNGCTQITSGGSVTAVLYRSSVSGGGACAASDNNCYTAITLTDTGTTCSGSADASFDVSGTASVKFFADPTDTGTYSADTWKVLVSANDGTATGTANEGTAVELNTLLALDVTGTISYGSMGVGTNSASSPQTVAVTNTGNANMDPQVSSAAAMTCTVGTIPIANQEYSSSTFTYNSGTDLSSTPATLNLALSKPTSTTPVTASSYWGIAVPNVGVSGSCTGTNVFTAVTGS
jgi:hypothetical protein